MDMRIRTQIRTIADAQAAENAGGMRVKNPLDAEPRQPASIYLPDAVVDASATKRPQYGIFRVGAAKLAAAMADSAARVVGLYRERFLFRQQRIDTSVASCGRNDWHAPEGDRERGWNHDRHVSGHSSYMVAAMHPIGAGTLIPGPERCLPQSGICAAAHRNSSASPAEPGGRR
jgi:hypothetical protein